MKTRVYDSIDHIPAATWNSLASGANPFLRHEFLAALERHDCVGAHLGWQPQHLAVEDEAGQMLGVAPMYIKHNSYGELVFDWAWADAYARAGRRYYPKLVIAIPYTPATGPRLLLADTPTKEAVADALIRGAIAHAEALGASSVHWLFTDPADTERLRRNGLIPRMGCQFHWHNRGYGDFDSYLDAFASAKRKKIRRERRRVIEAGVELRRFSGAEAGAGDWRVMHDFYRHTFDTKGGIPTLNLGCFEELGRTMGDDVLLVTASHGGRTVAGAISFVGQDTLYGRHWGCHEAFHSLHFEACYYQGLEYAIDRGLARFEPGAQGEHKVSRGFLPQATWSAHWIADPAFRGAIADFCAREAAAMEGYMEELAAHGPFREESGTNIAINIEKP